MCVYIRTYVCVCIHIFLITPNAVIMWTHARTLLIEITINFGFL